MTQMYEYNAKDNKISSDITRIGTLCQEIREELHDVAFGDVHEELEELKTKASSKNF
jgi:hypothetical protein